jgi:transposase-like protein
MTLIDGTGYVVSPLDGVNGNLIEGIDGRKGFPEPTASVYPQTAVQTCIVHLIRIRLMR